MKVYKIVEIENIQYFLINKNDLKKSSFKSKQPCENCAFNFTKYCSKYDCMNTEDIENGDSMLYLSFNVYQSILRELKLLDILN